MYESTRGVRNFPKERTNAEKKTRRGLVGHFDPQGKRQQGPCWTNVEASDDELTDIQRFQQEGPGLVHEGLNAIGSRQQRESRRDRNRRNRRTRASSHPRLGPYQRDVPYPRAPRRKETAEQQ